VPAPILILTGKANSGKDTLAGFLVKNHGAVAIASADPMKRFARDVLGFSEDSLWGPSEARNAVDLRGVDAIARLYYENHEAVVDWLQDVFGEDEDYDRFLAHLDAWHSRHLCKDRLTVSARHVLQTLGTEFGRSIDPNCWINYSLRMATKVLNEGGGYERLSGYVPGQGRPSMVVVSDGRFANEVMAVKSMGGVAVKIDPGEALSLKGQAGQHQSETQQDGIPLFWFDAVVENRKALGLAQLEANVDQLVTTLWPTVRIPFVGTVGVNAIDSAYVKQGLPWSRGPAHNE